MTGTIKQMIKGATTAAHLLIVPPLGVTFLFLELPNLISKLFYDLYTSSHLLFHAALVGIELRKPTFSCIQRGGQIVIFGLQASDGTVFILYLYQKLGESVSTGIRLREGIKPSPSSPFPPSEIQRGSRVSLQEQLAEATEHFSKKLYEQLGRSEKMTYVERLQSELLHL